MTAGYFNDPARPSDMELSRREALRAGGGLVTGVAAAGCIEERVTRRRTEVDSSTTWGLTPGVGDELDAAAFGSYVEEMASIYGDAGVWGTGEPPEADPEVAYAGRLPVVRATTRQPGGVRPTLSPAEIDRAAGFPVVDASVASYRLDSGRRRYRLWAAVDVRDETFGRDAEATVLSAGVAVRGGDLAETAAVTPDGDEATVTLGGDDLGGFPLSAGTDGLDATEETDVGGSYAVEWTGGVTGVQSLAGVCDVEPTGDYDLRWSVAGGYRTEAQV